MKKLLLLLLALVSIAVAAHGQGVITQQQIIQWRQGKPAGNPPATYVYMYFDPTSGNLTCVNSSGATTACSTLPTTVTANQCLLSTGVGTGSVWGSCSGTTSSNWNAIVPGTGTISAGTFNIGTGSTLTATGSGVINATQLGGATFAAPPAIGSGTPAAGSFTTLSASGQVTSTVSTGTAPFVVASTTVVTNLNAAALNGATFASPGAIGGTVPGSGAFTTLTGTSSITLGANGGTGGSVVLNGSTSGSATINASATGVLALPSGTTATSMALTTPVLGVATATSINRVTITAPATSATLTIADGKVLTASNSITLAAGADGQTFTFPATGAAVPTISSTSTFTNKTFDTAGTGNVFNIGGVGVTSSAPAGTQCLQSNGGATAIVWASCATGSIGGSGTANAMAKFTAAATIGNSLITDDGTIGGYSGSGGWNISAGPLKLTDIVAPTGGAGFGLLYSDSTSHRLTMKNGAGSAVNVVASGVDINTSDQVTATHLAAALPVNQGGSGTTSTLTGLVRGSASAMTAAELSADATTSGSNAVTVVALRNATLPTLAASTGLLFDTAGTLSLPSTLPTSAVPAFTGDATNSAGSLAMTVAKINGTAFSGTTGHLVSFASATTPGDSGVVGADVITYHTPATGIARAASGSQALTASELSGDATTSGSNAVTVVKINGNSVPSGAAVHQVAVATAPSTLTWKTIPDCAGSSNALNYTQSTDLFSCLSIATLSNPMTVLGQMIYGGSSGVVTALNGPTSGNSPYLLTSLPSGGIATAPTWAVMGVPVDSQSGATFTIQSDAQTTPDRGKLLNMTNGGGGSTSVTVPQAGSAGMASNYAFVACNSGGVGATLAPSVSTINGNSQAVLRAKVTGHNPECMFWWSDNANWFGAEILPTDSTNGYLAAEGFGSLTGDASSGGGTYAITVTGINGGAFTGTNGHVVSFGASNTPADSGIVATNVVTATGTLTSTALMTGGGTKTAQTPSTTSTLDASGNLAVAAGGSIGSADTGTPKFTFATNKVTLNQPLTLGTTSNQLVTGTTTNLTTLTFPASSGAVTLTFPNTTELMVGANSDTTTTHILHATAVAGVGAFSSLACADLPALTGDTTTSAGSCATTTAKINGTSFAGTNGNLVSFGAANIPADSAIAAANVVTAASNYTNGGLVYSNGTAKTTANAADWAIGGSGNHTLTGGANGILTSAGNGAASASAINVTGTVFTGGTATTTFPLVYFNQGASGPTTFSTSGTELGMNAVAAYAGNFLDFHVNGAASVFSVSAAGNVVASGTLSVTGHVTLEGVTSTGAQGTGALVFATSPTLTTPNIGAATGTSLLVTGQLDGTAGINITTTTACTLGTAAANCGSMNFLAGYTFNQEATAGTGVTYTLPATATGKQYCVSNSGTTGVVNTGVLTVFPPASSFVILNGVVNTVGGGGTHGVASGGAAGDSACFVAIDSTHWQVFVGKGTWTEN